MDIVICDLVKFKDVIKMPKMAVSVFGSARIDEDNEYFHLAKELSFKLASNDIAVISGGGNGIMKAANKGAFDAKKSLSFAFNIKMPTYQEMNEFSNTSYVFSSFSSRKVALTSNSMAFVVFPGGFGTLDELFEVLVLVQTGFKKAKIYLVGKKFWQGLDEFIKTNLISNSLIAKGDLDLYEISDDIDKIVEEILEIRK